MKRFLITLSFVCLCMLSYASISVKHIKTDTENFPHNVISAFQVLDAADEPVEDLDEDNISIMLDSSTTKIMNVSTYDKSGHGANIMLCIDISGSMKGRPIQAVKNAILPFIDEVRKTDRIAISVYEDGYQLLCDFSSDKDLLKRIVSEIEPRGNYTSFYYGAHKGLEHLVNYKTDGVKIMVLLGDGKDENPTQSYTEDDVIALSKEHSTPIFGVGFTRVEAIYLQSLERMANQTGGTYYYAPSASDLKKYFGKLNNQINKIYILNYAVYGMTGDGQEHDLKIVVNTEMGEERDTAKIGLPHGAAPIEEPREKSGGSLDTSLVLIILGASLLVLIIIFLIASSKKKNRKEKERIEAERQAEIKEAEIQKAEESKRLGEELDRQKQKAEEQRYQKPVDAVNREQTMILNAGCNELKIDFEYGVLAGQTKTINKNGATIGRAADNDIVIPDSTVSSHHARISCSSGSFTIEDMGSLNGTYINGNKITIYRFSGNCTFMVGSSEGRISLV